MYIFNIYHIIIRLDRKMKQICQTRDITIPEGVTIEIKARKIRVKGPRGVLYKDFKHVNFQIKRVAANKLRVLMYHGNRKQVACIRTVCTHIENLMKGVTKGYEYKMRLVAAHFPINVNIADEGKLVEIRNFLGEKLIRKVQMLDGVTAAYSASQKDEIVISGNDVENVSQSAANIHQACLVKNKDIRKFLDGIYVSEKVNDY